MNAIQHTESDIRYLLSPQAIRERTLKIYEHAIAGRTHFKVNEAMLDEVAEFVLETTLANYPDLKIPFHSRWGHFRVGGMDRLADLDSQLRALDPAERARTKLDLVIASVLLDAGAGMSWKFTEGAKTFGRSEGLAVASLHMFLNGDFSSSPAHPLRVDSEGLKRLSVERLAQGFQVSEKNPLVGLKGRVQLLRSLGAAIEKDQERFGGAHGIARPGAIFDFCLKKAVKTDGKLQATELLLAVLHGLGPIWPGRIQLGSTPMGDVWPHPLLGGGASAQGLVPFHKLSQWLTYSLIEPIEEAGLPVVGVDQLTGLAEYRNGGLVLDKKLIELRDPALASKVHRPDSELVIEWRALTLVLLEQIAERVRERLGKTSDELPLAKVLEGGTWWAGRKIAAELRSDGSPPLKIESDGTVF